MQPLRSYVNASYDLLLLKSHDIIPDSGPLYNLISSRPGSRIESPGFFTSVIDIAAHERRAMEKLLKAAHMAEEHSLHSQKQT
jgi:hypothetical protein